VHADSKGNLAVIGVMFTEGKSNPALAKLWEQLPEEEGEPIALKNRVTPSELMPNNKGYYRFSGSLTAPPCSEGVRWLLMKNPITASKEQIDAFKKAVHHSNNRPVQALNGRVIID
jgi:carbonic anhydrase